MYIIVAPETSILIWVLMCMLFSRYNYLEWIVVSISFKAPKTAGEIYTIDK